MESRIEELVAVATLHEATCECATQTQYGTQYRIVSADRSVYTVWLYNSGKRVLQGGAIGTPLHDSLMQFCRPSPKAADPPVTQIFVLDPIRFPSLTKLSEQHGGAPERPLRWRGLGWVLEAWETGAVLYQGPKSPMLDAVHLAESQWLDDITQDSTASQESLIASLRVAASSVQSRRQDCLGLFEDGSAAIIGPNGQRHLESGDASSAAARWIDGCVDGRTYAIGVASTRNSAVAVALVLTNSLRDALKRVDRSKLMASADYLERLRARSALTSVWEVSGRQTALRSLVESLDGEIVAPKTGEIAAFADNFGLKFVTDDAASAFAQALAQRVLQGTEYAP